jgi:hypothetical protein
VSLFHDVTLRGRAASLAWGWHTAARVTAWSLTRAKKSPTWVLSARAVELDPFKCRQPDLLFAVPRKGGYWVFPVQSLTVQGTSITGTLGHPQQG